MTEKRVWFSTAEIKLVANSWPQAFDKGKVVQHPFQTERWLSSEGAGALANQTRSMRECLEDYLKDHEKRAGDSRIRAVIIGLRTQEKVLRGEDDGK